MTRLFNRRRLGLRAALGMLFVLHLGVMQASMIPAAHQVHVTSLATTVTASAEESAAPCHHGMMTQDTVPTAQHPTGAQDGGCCDQGQCHCPIAMGMHFAGAPGQPQWARHLDRPVEASTAPSRRLAPDLRPPIAV